MTKDELITCNSSHDYPYFMMDLKEVCTFFDKIIKKSKSAKKRQQARELKVNAIEGLFMTYSCFYEDGMEVARATVAEYEEVES